MLPRKVDKYRAAQISSDDVNLQSDLVKVNFSLEQRQNKNDSIQSKIIPILKLPHFFPQRIGDEKTRQFQSWN